ncbi:MAG: YidB family protein [Pseudomonadota bacterium]
MANDFLGQILGSVLSRGGAQAPSGNVFGGGGGGLGDLLGGLLGGRSGGVTSSGSPGGTGAGFPEPAAVPERASPAGSPYLNKTTLMAMLLPLAFRWVQRNGGIGNVLQRFREKGYGSQASSWVSTGPNHALAPGAIDEVLGDDELADMSRQLGVDRQEVSGGFAEILPEVVNQLSPQGEVEPDADDRLSGGAASLDRFFNEIHGR